ncbi:Ger(x)C family spore germination protein [Tumebacillus sp. DT12]|uniref:Ger(X)C family spore germination protein n=1 Tax=Tumebacillus lacus TaxID=2995335 RepID=A0ABT3X7A3_9BACL|nr:Ger(x)C family spore germination protein [Tumebacillus lacus]MCX7571868.1 Ger(x)C family spore germination protein [Tumebacillus lacus]
MKKWLPAALSFLLLLPLTACGKQNYLERTNIVLGIAIDRTDKDQLLVIDNQVLFSTALKEKSITSSTKAPSVRAARENLNAMSRGSVTGSKLQVLLLGKRLLQEKDVMPLIDVVFRDAKNATNARVIAVDDSIEEIMSFMPRDKTHLSVYLSDLVDNAYDKRSIARTEIKQFHYQYFEEGITPAITQLKKSKNEIIVTGTALLNNKATYIVSLDRKESVLLQALQENVESASVPYTIPVAGKGQVSIDLRSKQKVKTSFVRGKFRFDIQMKISASLLERTFTMNAEKQVDEITKMVQAQLLHDARALVKKLQDHHVDPVGFGLHARAFEYSHWKKVQDHWPDAFADADVHLTLDVEMKGLGAVK